MKTWLAFQSASGADVDLCHAGEVTRIDLKIQPWEANDDVFYSPKRLFSLSLILKESQEASLKISK